MENYIGQFFLIFIIITCCLIHKKCRIKIIDLFNICENFNMNYEKKIFTFLQKNFKILNIFFIIIGIPYILTTIFNFFIPYTWDNLFGLIIIITGDLILFSVTIYLLISLPIYLCSSNDETKQLSNNKKQQDKINSTMPFVVFLIFLLFLFTIITYLLIRQNLQINSVFIAFLISIVDIYIYSKILKSLAKYSILRIFIFIIIALLFMIFSFPTFLLKRYHIANYPATLRIKASNPICFGRKIIKNKENNYCEINTTIYWDNGSQTIFLKESQVHKLNNSEILDTILYNEVINLNKTQNKKEKK